jgi:hypothetical protein
MDFEDKNGQMCIMTPVTNVANPDFAKIKHSGFSEYYYEPFTETLKRYGRHPETFQVWKKGIEMGIFIPESHGREHISVQFWMKKLFEGDKKLRFAFDNEFINVPLDGMNKAIHGFRPEFYFNDPGQIYFLKNSIITGVNLFREIFGYTPRAFVPSNGIFHPSLEAPLSETGIKYLNVNHFNPVPDKNGNLKKKWYKIGKTNSSGLTYYNRNCAFEPVRPDYNGIYPTIRQIDIAFKWNKPAIISTHRCNFIGGIDKSNRDNGLKELRILLNMILRKWPDVEFSTIGKLHSS